MPISGIRNAFRMKKSVLLTTGLFLLSLITGLIIYSATEYDASTLVIRARTMQEGYGQVVVDGAEGGKSRLRTFQVEDSRGEDKSYVIELPAMKLKSLRIAPLSTPGSFEITGITLSNDAIRYDWDANGGCTQRVATGTTVTRGACSDNAPAVVSDGDMSVLISGIPGVGTYRKPWLRVALACVAALGFFLGGMWLLRPVGENRFMPAFKVQAVRISWLALVILYLYQLYLVLNYSVDVPFVDEWRYFYPHMLPSGLSWKLLFSFDNDHRRVLTHLFAWLNLKLFNFDFTKALIFNYLVFGCLILVILRFKEKVVGRKEFAVFPAFLIFLMSLINYENHMWSVCLALHFVLIFSILALCHAFSHEMPLKRGILFSLFVVLGVYNFSAGLVFAIVYQICLTVFVIANIAGGRTEKKSGLQALALTYLLIGSGVALWFVGYVKPSWSQSISSPFGFKFWSYYLNVLSLGFGFTSEQMIPGIVCLGITITPVAILLARRDTRWQPSSWMVLSAIASVLAVIAAISMGRTDLTPAKTSRYAEFGFLLIPYVALAWWLALEDRLKRFVVLAVFWTACATSYADTWFIQIYPYLKQESMETLDCVEKYYQGLSTDPCQEPNPVLKRDRALQMEMARKMRVSFTKQFD